MPLLPLGGVERFLPRRRLDVIHSLTIAAHLCETTPRIHDFRHSFAVNALLRWYHAGADVDAKLQLLATYLGHGSALSTHHYLHFIEPMRAAANKRFARLYGSLIVPTGRKGRPR
jgi:integrase/recombinase XerD